MPGQPQNRWNSSFALRIPAVDAQHQALFELAYDLDCAIHEGRELAAVEGMIERLKEYCQYHFVTEERLMHEYGYEGLHRHTLQHDGFTSAVIEFDAQRGSGTKGVAQRIVSFLKEWLPDHIGVEDRKYVPILLHPVAGQRAAQTGVPLLVEVEAAGRKADTAVCARVAELLRQNGIYPVGLVGSLDQTRSSLEELQSHGLTPAIFVVNTLGAKDILANLDSLMGDLPVLYLRRALCAGKSGLLDQVNLVAPSALMATSVLGRMKPRLTSMWFYGARNTEKVAARAAEVLGAFLRTGDFRQIERTKAAQ